MTNRQKLELTWIGKEHRPRLEPRILLEDPTLSYHASHRVKASDPQITPTTQISEQEQSEPNLRKSAQSADTIQAVGDIFDNKLIQGDNLLALKALEAEYAGQVKCVYIDPPFNTGQAFEHYDDGVEHSLWLSLMRDRLYILQKLLSPDGSIWVHCDDNEQAYLKVMMDEIFGRSSFIGTVVWQSRYSRSNDASLSMSHNFILVYSPSPEQWKLGRNRLTRTDEQADQYKNPDADIRGPWRAIPWDAPNIRPNLSYPIITPTGRVRLPPAGRCWSRTENQWQEIVKAGLAYFGKSGDGAPSFKQFLKDAPAIVPNTWWPHEEAGHTDEAKKEAQTLFSKEEAFATPKPERLMERIIHIATNPGDLVLDSFAGSGTTGAVAHKMGRRWIMVELGEHAVTHIVPRLRKVIDGADAGGITKAVEWPGGGGFRFYRLAPSLLEQDRWGNWVINRQYNAAMLAEALCKLEGFTYAPSDTLYWQHGHSTERDFIYVTTATLTHEQLQQLSEDVGPERTLLVLCGAFRGGEYPNLTLRKIPRQVLSRCEWGHDDYSLQVENLPKAPGKTRQEQMF